VDGIGRSEPRQHLPGGTHPCKYGIAISTNSYGDGYPTGGYTKYNADQGTGIWTRNTSATRAGPLVELTSWSTPPPASGPIMPAAPARALPAAALLFRHWHADQHLQQSVIGQACPFYIHNQKMSKNGLYAVITDQADLYPVCTHHETRVLGNDGGNLRRGALVAAAFFPGSIIGIFGTNKIVAFNDSGWGNGGFLGIYGRSQFPKSSQSERVLEAAGHARHSTNDARWLLYNFWGDQ